MRKAQKQIAEENKRKAVKLTTEKAEIAASDGKGFCISRVDVGLDAVAVREAVIKVMEQKVTDYYKLNDNLLRALAFYKIDLYLR